MWFKAMLVVVASLLGPEEAQGVTAQPPPDQAGSAAVRSEPQAPLDAGLVSLERIKKELARSPSPGILTESANRTPDFRVYVQGTPFRMSAIEETLRQDWRPIQPGSIYHNEFLARVTRPEAMPYAGFTGGGLAAVAASSLMSYVVIGAVQESVRLIRKGVRAHQLTETRREITDAIAAIERNKLAATNQSPPVRKQP
jgi:hypothetical protein